jgi:hypothetical protein
LQLTNPFLNFRSSYFKQVSHITTGRITLIAQRYHFFEIIQGETQAARVADKTQPLHIFSPVAPIAIFGALSRGQ